MTTSTTQPTLHDDLAYSIPPYFVDHKASWNWPDTDAALNTSWLLPENCTGWTTARCSPLPPSVHGTHSPASETTLGDPYNDHSGAARDHGRPLAEMLDTVASFRAAMVLVVWLFPLVVAIGVVGNAVSLWVLLRRGMRRTSACR